MRDKRPAIIAVLSIILIGLIIYIIQDLQTDSPDGTAETPTEQPTQTDQPSEETSEEPEEPVNIKEPIPPEFPIWYEEGPFELPLIGAGGYTSVEQKLFAEPDTQADVLVTLKAGAPFVIEQEIGEWWRVKGDSGTDGWIQHKTAMINLPDVIPSIIYDHTNSYNSQFRSSFVDIPELTGESLYDMRAYSDRLGEDSYIMPILYQTAKKVQAAQQIALQNGEALKVYETFRPRDIQLLVNEALSKLAKNNSVVKTGITEKPWSLTWFINTSVSNHQKGLAIDLTLVKIEKLTERIVGDYHVPKILEYTEYEMQTPFHELSTNSAMFTKPIASSDQEGWKNMTLNSAVTEPALRLQEYMTAAGFTPLASEWWHFNDVDTLNQLKETAGTGEYRITELINRPPRWEELQEFMTN